VAIIASDDVIPSANASASASARAFSSVIAPASAQLPYSKIGHIAGTTLTLFDASTLSARVERPY
jgi:hypothetical protein